MYGTAAGNAIALCTAGQTSHPCLKWRRDCIAIHVGMVVQSNRVKVRTCFHARTVLRRRVPGLGLD